MGGQTFPTTDDYKIEVNINLSKAHALSGEFMAAAKGGTLDEYLPKFVHAVLGRDITVITDKNAGEYDSKYRYYYDREHKQYEEELHFGTKEMELEEKLVGNFGKNPDFLPPNIPKELTPELMDFLTALHEMEHTTQYNIPQKEDGEVKRGSVSSAIVKLGAPLSSRVGSGFEIMGEVDAEGAPMAYVATYLREEGMENIAQFYEDMREFNLLDWEHDLSLVLSHHEETGEVIDPAYYAQEMRGLYMKVIEGVGIDCNYFSELLSQYSYEDIKKVIGNAALENDMNNLPKKIGDVTPQKFMYAAQKLLESGELEGVSKMKAEKYVEAMERLGYKPDPQGIVGYKEAVKEVIDKYLGEPSETGERVRLPPAEKLLFGS
jgi:hypothetical protein